MNKENPKHIWFDFSETIAFLNKETHDRLRYETFAKVTNREVTPELVAELEELYQKFAKSNSAIFRSLGMPGNYWSDVIKNSVPPSELYHLADENIPSVLEQLRQKVPISMFSNLDLQTILPALGIDTTWFTHFISAGMVREPKPALEGYQKIVELTRLPADQTLYIGDDVRKDILPAQQVGLQAGLMWSADPQADYSFANFDEVLGLYE